MTEPLTARASEIVVAAREMLDEHGAEALTMRRLAERLGIRAPSLYKHLPDKAALEAAVIATGLEDLAVALEESLHNAAEPLAALTAAYRAFAVAHPHLYLLMTNRPLPREHLPQGVEDRAGRPRRRMAGRDHRLPTRALNTPGRGCAPKRPYQGSTPYDSPPAASQRKPQTTPVGPFSGRVAR